MNSIPFKKLAVTSLLTGLMSVAGGASAHVTYNLGGNGDGSFPADGDNVSWSAGDPGYSGNLPATWVAFIHNHGGTANTQTASSAGAIAGGISNGLKTGARAYKDGSTNWGHGADFGLFELEHDANVTISVSSDASNLRPAFGLWSGWDTESGSSRHAAYKNNGAINPMAANPLGTNLGLVDANAWAFAAAQGTSATTATATLSRFLSAGKYTLIIGGYDGTPGAYKYTATIAAAASAPVPVPAAVWLFGSALAGLAGVSRRKQHWA